MSAADTTHHLVIDTTCGEPTLTLVCTAAKGAGCRMRPPEGDDRETWRPDDPDLIDGECWAVEWISEGGWEDSVRCADGAKFPRIPVEVTYDEGVWIAPVDPHPTLPIEEKP